MKRIIINIILSATLISCNDNQSLDNLDLPYFQFKTGDTEKFIELPELNKSLTYKDQNNEELIFKVIKSQSKKELHTTGSFVYGSTKYFYYDEQKIYLQSTLFNSNDIHKYIEIKLKRCPREFNDGRNGYPKLYQTNQS